MKSISKYKRGVAKAKKLSRQGDFSQAWRLVDRLLQEWPNNPTLLVMWSDLLQLQEDENQYTLDDVRTCYQCAADLDSQSPAPRIELGHFQLAVDDNLGGAIRSYDKAISLSKKLLRDALPGKAKALQEMGETEKALD